MATNNNEFFDALAALEKERGLPADYLIDKIKAAIVIAVKKDYEVEDDKDRKSTRLNSSHSGQSRMPSSA